VITFLREPAPVDDHHPVGLAQVLCDQLLVSLQEAVVIPSTFTNELLHCTYSVDVFPALAQDHRFDALTLQLRKLSTQIQLRPFSLLSAFKQGRVFGGVLTQLRGQILEITPSQILTRPLSAWRRFRVCLGRLLYGFTHYLLPVGFTAGRLSKINFSL
jgi:hypothetical protein